MSIIILQTSCATELLFSIVSRPAIYISHRVTLPGVCTVVYLEAFPLKIDPLVMFKQKLIAEQLHFLLFLHCDSYFALNVTELPKAERFSAVQISLLSRSRFTERLTQTIYNNVLVHRFICTSKYICNVYVLPTKQITANERLPTPLSLSAYFSADEHLSSCPCKAREGGEVQPSLSLKDSL